MRRLAPLLLLAGSCQLLVKFEPPPERAAQCDDQIDNDDDGDIDCGDADCNDTAACGASLCGNGRVDAPQFVLVEGAMIAVPGGPFLLAQASINGDAQPDVVVATATDVRELRGGNNTLAAQAPLSVSTIGPVVGMAVGRFDAGASDDLALLLGEPARQVLPVLNDSGTLRTGRVATVGDSGPVSIVAGNFNGQPGDDVLVGSSEAATFFAGNGQGMFATGVTLQVPATPRTMATGDYDHDGDLDVVAVSRLGMQAYLLTTVAATTPFRPEMPLSIGAEPGAVTFAALVGNTLGAVVLEERAMNARPLLNAGGMLSSGMVTPLSGTPVSIVAADLNLDSLVDIAVGLRSGSILLFTGDGMGAFFAAGTLNGAGADAMIAVPIDGRRGAELVVAEKGQNRVRIYSNQSVHEQCDGTPGCRPDCTLP